MRIIAGEYRGKILCSPKDLSVRPTSDRARESIFNIIRPYLNQETKLLDLFAGSGAFGLEAISRGVKKVTFVEKNTETLNKNVALFPKDKDRIEVLRADATNLPRAKEKFDIIFMDAPYHKGLSEKSLTSLLAQNWLNENALIIIETAKNEELNTDLVCEDIRNYGAEKFCFFRCL